MLERLFKLREHGTTARTEILGGITTFITMAYIIVVNPAILSFAGNPAGSEHGGDHSVGGVWVATDGAVRQPGPSRSRAYMGENAVHRVRNGGDGDRLAAHGSARCL